MADKKPLCLYEGDLRELQAGDTLSPVSDHEAAADPHLGYALESALGTAAASNVEDFEASGTVSSHEAALDPHPGYALETSLGTAATQDATAFEPANAVSTHNALTGTSVHGLGTASTANVTTSATDTTAGRVLKVGDYQGLLSENYQDSPLASLLTAADPSDIAYSGCTLFGSLSGTGKWYGGVLAPNGKIYGIPRDSTQVLEIDPATQTTTLFGSLSGNNKWNGGVLAPNGKIYGIPYNSTQVLEIDPTTKTTTLFGSLSGTGKWIGGVLAPNGKIYGIPVNSTQVLEIDGVSNGKHWWALSKYTNKF